MVWVPLQYLVELRMCRYPERSGPAQSLTQFYVSWKSSWSLCVLRAWVTYRCLFSPQMIYQSHRLSPSQRRLWLWWARTSGSRAQQPAAAAPLWPLPGRRTMRSWSMLTWRTLPTSEHRMGRWWSIPPFCTSVVSLLDMRAATSVSSPTTSAPPTRTRPGSLWMVGGALFLILVLGSYESTLVIIFSVILIEMNETRDIQASLGHYCIILLPRWTQKKFWTLKSYFQRSLCFFYSVLLKKIAGVSLVFLCIYYSL